MNSTYKRKGSYCRTGIHLAALIVLVFSLVVLSPVRLYPQKVRLKEKPHNVVPSPREAMAVFRGIEKAWLKEDAAAISKYAGGSKVFIDVRGIRRRGGYYSKSQVFYLMKKLFASTRQVRFSFVRYSSTKGKSTRAFGIARRIFKDSHKGAIVQDKVYVTLKREGRRWVLAEIKSTR